MVISPTSQRSSVYGDPMKIATWNVERLKTHQKLPEIVGCCHAVDADIFVLTETDTRIRLVYPYHSTTLPLHACTTPRYRTTERRVAIFSRYPLVREHPTSDPYTTLCVEVATPRGHLLVYGTIMGIYGNRHSSFREAVEKQLDDVDKLVCLGLPLCVCGDFNCSFADNYYFTNWGRTQLTRCFTQHQLALLTKASPACIDHIAISQTFVADANCVVQEWNDDKSLSDHKGISVALQPK